MDLDLDLKPFAGDLDLSGLRYLLARDSSGDEDEDLDLYSHFPTVTQVEIDTYVDLPPVQVRRVVDLRDYGPSAEIDIENLDDLQLHRTMCKISIYSQFI